MPPKGPPRTRTAQSTRLTFEADIVPTHNNIPCASSWRRHPLLSLTPPKASIQIYYTPNLENSSTSPASPSPISAISDIALKLHQSPLGWNDMQNYTDRLDVYSLPINDISTTSVFQSGGRPNSMETALTNLDPFKLTSEERLAHLCISHQKAEIAYRAFHNWIWTKPNTASPNHPSTNRIGIPKESFIQTWESRIGNFSNYRRFLIIVDREEGKWDDEGVLFVWFEKKGNERHDPDWNAIKEVKVERVKGIKTAGTELASVRLAFNWQRQRAQWGDVCEDD